MTNRDLYGIALGIKKCDALVNIADINFTMTIARIDSEVQAELRIIDAGKKKYPDGFIDYTKKKKAIDLKYAIQKEDGTFQMLDNDLLVRDPNNYYLEIDALNEEYKDTIDKVEVINKEFTEFLNLPCKVTITKLPKSCIPACVNVEQIKLLFPVIE